MTGFLVGCLAAWRLTELVVEDEVARSAREAVSRRWPGGGVAYLLSCKRCVSVWAALAVVIMPGWMSRVLAASSVTILVNDAREAQAAEALRRRLTGGDVRRETETG